MISPITFVLAALALASTAGAQDAPVRPNVLLIYSDDQRADTIGAWGNPFIDTPHLDALVERGVSLRRTYCMGSPHGALCVPSRAMLFTGRDYHGLDLREMEGCRTLGQALREAGYTSFGTGKWHNGRGVFRRTFDIGRSVYFGGMADHHAIGLVDMLPEGFSEPTVNGTHSSELFADAAIEFLSGYEGDAPFFCYVALTAPHDPRDPPRPFAERYYDARPPLPRNFLPQHPFDNGFLTTRDEKLGAWPRTVDMVSDQLSEYYGLITHMDEQIGRVLAALEATGRAENTLVVFAADHGLAMGSHGLLGKQSLYEHSLRAPVIVSGPDLPRGTSSVALCYLFDLYPTVLNFAGARPDVGIEGKDLGPVLRGETAEHRDELFLSLGKTQRAISDGRWKLLRYPQVDVTQLFDLASDPDELVDLSAAPAHAARVAQLWGRLEDSQRQYGDQLPLRVDEPGPRTIDLTGRERKSDRWQPRWIRRKYFGEH